MNARLALVGGAALVLAMVGGGWWVVRDDADKGPGPGSTGPETSPGASSSAPPAAAPSSSSRRSREGRPVSACAPAEPAGRIPATYWGMHVGDPIAEDFPDAPISAVNLTTSQVYWNQVETAPGHYEFSRLDDIVSTAEERRARPLLVMGFTPPFHARQPESPTARSTMPDPDAWRAWVSAVVERYGDSLDYQVWPEPNIVSNWSDSPAQMARLTVMAGEIIHDRAPDAQVVAPATTLRLRGQRQWMDRFWGTAVDGVPVADAVDAVALDPFPLEDGTPEDALDLICQAQEILAENEVDLPVWTNEINYGVPSGGGATDVQRYRDDRQAAAVARTYLLHAAVGIDRVYWLGWGSYPGLAVEMERDGVTSPAGTAFSVVRGWLAGRPRPSCHNDDGMHTCLVVGPDEELRIHWRVRGTSTVRAPEGVDAVETATGERRKVAAGDRVRIGQAPVAVFSAG